MINERAYPPLHLQGRGTARRAVEGPLEAEGPLHHASHGPPPLEIEGRNKEEGFTLVELMVVLVILGLLATIVVINVMPAMDRAERTKAQADISTLDEAVKMYRLENRRYPTSEEGLQALVASRNLDRLPNDPWNNPYAYTVPGPDGRPYAIMSLGADGREGGDGENEDLTN